MFSSFRLRQVAPSQELTLLQTARIGQHLDACLHCVMGENRDLGMKRPPWHFLMIEGRMAANMSVLPARWCIGRDGQQNRIVRS